MEKILADRHVLISEVFQLDEFANTSSLGEYGLTLETTWRINSCKSSEGRMSIGGKEESIRDPSKGLPTWHILLLSRNICGQTSRLSIEDNVDMILSFHQKKLHEYLKNTKINKAS
jgi:hypothetical protein